MRSSFPPIAGVGSIAVLPQGSHGRFTSFPQVAGHSGEHLPSSHPSPSSNSLVYTSPSPLLLLFQPPHPFPGFVTDFDFSPFHDRLLATGAEDCLVKLWQIPEGGVSGTLSSPTVTLDSMEVWHVPMHYDIIIMYHIISNRHEWNHFTSTQRQTM